MAERSKSSGKKKTAAAQKSSTRKKAATKKTATPGKKAPAKKKAVSRPKAVAKPKTAPRKKAAASKPKAAPGKKTPAKKASPTARPGKKTRVNKAASAVAGVVATASLSAAEQLGLVEPENKKLPPVKIGKRDMAQIETNLHGSRAQLTQDVDALTQNNLSHSGRDMSGDLSGYGFHMADVATDNFAREMELNIATGETDRLRLVEEALDRMRDGNFGRCLECDEPVGVARLKVIPYARLCIGCAEEAERA